MGDASKSDDQHIRILLVEDNAGDAELVQAMLRRSGHLRFEVDVECCLAAALEYLRQDDPGVDVILADLHLPDAEGMETVRRLREEAGLVPVVVLTSGDLALGQQVIREGAQDFVNKGSDGDTLRRVLRFAMLRAGHQKTLVEYERRLIHADRLAALGQLAAGVSHEINNPATYIGANLEQLRRTVEGLRHGNIDGEALRAVLEEMLSMIDDSREGFRQIKAITRDLRGFARVSRDEAELTDVNEAVRSAVNLTGGQLRHVAKLKVDLRPVPPIVAERAKIVQVFVNLLINAGQAIGESGTKGHHIMVRSRREGDALQFEVADDGPGIPENVRRRIFEPFFTTKPADDGTGLGLAVCRDCVRVHRGTIEVESELGSGTTFRVVLPLETGLSMSHIPPPPSSTARRPRRARLLVIDDDRMVRRSLRRSLSGHHDVVEAGGGHDAIRRLQEDDSFDVVICDLMMPDVDGAEVLAWMESHRPSLVSRLVFISGGAFTQRGREILNRGCRVIGKPIEANELLEAVDATVARHGAG